MYLHFVDLVGLRVVPLEVQGESHYAWTSRDTPSKTKGILKNEIKSFHLIPATKEPLLL